MSEETRAKPDQRWKPYMKKYGYLPESHHAGIGEMPVSD
jgi:hypothetical protein